MWTPDTSVSLAEWPSATTTVRYCGTAQCDLRGRATVDNFCNRCGLPTGTSIPAPVDVAPGSPAEWPSLATTVIVTFLFGFVGAVPAALHTEAVRRLGTSTPRYWQAFGFTMVVTVITDAVLLLAIL
jgi:hypothetical protein